MDAPDTNSAAETPQPSCTFFKKSVRNKNLRKRTGEDDAQDEGNAVAVVRKTKVRKNDRTLEEEAPEELTKGSFYFESSKEVQTQNDSRATATLETETEFDRDARAIREMVLKQADEALKGKGSADNKTYKGLHGYTDHRAGFRREQTVAGEKAGGAHGPLRASAHIRWSVRFDYQPDICKDYKETGYCGYGDSCKFMHDRGDYKSGWQLEKEWDDKEKQRKAKLARGASEVEQEDEQDLDDDGLPFACFICRQAFVDPVVTTCKHYFCEHCALKHHSRNKLCFVCEKPTNGVFNTAQEILKRIKELPSKGKDKQEEQTVESD